MDIWVVFMKGISSLAWFPKKIDKEFYSIHPPICMSNQLSICTDVCYLPSKNTCKTISFFFSPIG